MLGNAKLIQQIAANMTLGRLSPLLNLIRRHRPIIKHTSFVFYSFVTWLPALIWMNSKVGEVAWIQGGSMYPYLNTDIDRSTKQDACWNNKWKPLQGLRRGMIVTFWFVMLKPL
jgi:mitochondrial inner membrane protease subunit 2